MSKQNSWARSGDDVIVVGAGLMGLSSAFFLQSRGLRVTVVERDAIGSGAARGNGGIIVANDCVPLPAPGMVADGLKALFSASSSFYVKPSNFPRMAPFLTRFALQSTPARFKEAAAKLDILNRRTMQLWEMLRDNGIGDHIQETPFLFAFGDRAAAEAAHRFFDQHTTARDFRTPDPLLDGPELRAYEPALSDRVVAGFLHRGDRWGDPSLFVDQLETYLRSAGVEFIEGVEVTGLSEGVDSVTVHGRGQRWQASQVLVTAGAWSKQLLHQLGTKVILHPGKGYSLSIDVETAPKGVVMLSDAHVGVTPMGERTVRIAGTMEFDGHYDGINHGRVHKIIEEAKPLLKSADWNSVRDEWMGPRPMTSDGLPYIGRLPAHRRVFTATGHNMIGFSLGPATGDLVARLMTGEADPAAEAAFSPGRFRR